MKETEGLLSKEPKPTGSRKELRLTPQPDHPALRKEDILSGGSRPDTTLTVPVRRLETGRLEAQSRR